jgi:predicted Fe-Mo cluster-binding NifX family protein
MKEITVLFFVFWSLLLPLRLFAAENSGGNIAVASDGRLIGSAVAERMGRARYYLVYDRNGTFLRAVDNPNFGKRAGPQGRSAVDSITFDEKSVMTGGITSPSKGERGETWNDLSRFFGQNGVTVVVAEQFGDLIITEMKIRGIQCVGFRGTSEDAVRSIVQKKRQ